jgi:5S rRNA maturation endonuclease (ribonuclease M5)
MSWCRVSRSHPCIACGKPDWCGKTGDGSMAICMRVPSERPSGNGGWLHPADHRIFVTRSHRSPVSSMQKVTRCGHRGSPKQGHVASRWRAMVEECYEAMSTPEREDLAVALGLTLESLQLLGVGWIDREFEKSSAQGTWRLRGSTWPMAASDGQYVGVKVRLQEPWGRCRKLCVPGSTNGLTLNPALSPSGPVWIVEGETDAAAFLSIGISNVVGVPGAGQAAEVASEVVYGRIAIIVQDADEAGEDGADRLARELSRYASKVFVVSPEVGCKDVREAVSKGATKEDVQRWIR